MMRDFSFSANIHNYFSFPSPTSKFCLSCAASCLILVGVFPGVFLWRSPQRVTPSTMTE